MTYSFARNFGFFLPFFIFLGLVFPGAACNDLTRLLGQMSRRCLLAEMFAQIDTMIGEAPKGKQQCD